MTASRRRARVALVALATFLGLLVVAAGLMWIGRSTPPESEPRAVQDEGGSTSNEPIRRSNPGRATRQPADEAGAVDAAIAYAMAPQEWLYLEDREIQASIDEVAAPDAAGRLADEVLPEVGEARSRLAEAAGPVWWIVHPLATRVDSYGSADATVSVWTVSLLSAADVAMPQTDWTTSTFHLKWIDGRWRIAAVTDTAGPTPAIGPTDQPWEPEALDEALEGFHRLTWETSR